MQPGQTQSNPIQPDQTAKGGVDKEEGRRMKDEG